MTISSSNFMPLTGLICGATTMAANQYYCVALESTAKQVKLSVLPTTPTIGILQNDPAVGEACLISVSGPTKAAAEASVAIGDWVAASTTGRVKTTTSANDDIVGRALEASSAAGDIITIMVAVSNF
jgi:hypothetical protein